MYGKQDNFIAFFYEFLIFTNFFRRNTSILVMAYSSKFYAKRSFSTNEIINTDTNLRIITTTTSTGDSPPREKDDNN